MLEESKTTFENYRMLEKKLDAVEKFVMLKPRVTYVHKNETKREETTLSASNGSFSFPRRMDRSAYESIFLKNKGKSHTILIIGEFPRHLVTSPK